jgi:hypothetical protein
MKLALLVRFYPARWRERYSEEIADLLATELPSVPRAVDILRGLIDAHLHPELVHSALAAVPAPGERSAEMRTYGAGTVARLARVAMLTGLIVTPVAAGAAGYYLGRSQVSPVVEPALFPIRTFETARFEDKTFWTDPGIDIGGIIRAMKR